MSGTPESNKGLKKSFIFFGKNTNIRETFLPHLFFIKKKSLSPIVGALSTMTIEKYRLGIMNPVTSEKEKYLIFHQARTELIRDVTVGGGVLEHQPPSGAQGRKA